jgi:hypothetical protein
MIQKAYFKSTYFVIFFNIFYCSKFEIKVTKWMAIKSKLQKKKF